MKIILQVTTTKGGSTEWWGVLLVSHEVTLQNKTPGH